MKKKKDSTPEAMLKRVIRVAEILAKTHENSLENQHLVNSDSSNMWTEPTETKVQKSQR